MYFGWEGGGSSQLSGMWECNIEACVRPLVTIHTNTPTVIIQSGGIPACQHTHTKL